MKKACVPTELIKTAIKDFLFIVSEIIDEKDQYSETEIRFLMWGSKFEAVMQPFTGPILMPDPPRQDKGAKL